MDARAGERLEIVKTVVAGERPALASTNPYQRPSVLYYPALRAQTLYDCSEFGWTSRLREAFGVIRDELRRCLERRTGFEPAYPAYSDDGKWATLWYYLYGQRYDQNCALFPKTVEVIESITGLAGWACYSAVAPGSHIRPHCGATNAKLRLHYAIQAEPGSFMRVAETYYEWREGEIMIFDDSFEHEVWASGTGPRIVLIVDFYHPDLCDREVEFLRAFEATPSPLLNGKSLRSRYQDIHQSFAVHPNAQDADWVYGGRARVPLDSFQQLLRQRDTV